jgi:hypothetical protein
MAMSMGLSPLMGPSRDGTEMAAVLARGHPDSAAEGAVHRLADTLASAVSSSRRAPSTRAATSDSPLEVETAPASGASTEIS